jgi:hypothetical protein
LCLIFHVCKFSRHNPGPKVCIFLISRFSLFLTIFQVVQCVSHFPSFSVILAIFLVLPCEFLILLVCQFYRHFPGHTVFVSHFPRLSVFSPQSRPYGVYFFIFHVFQYFLPYFRFYNVHFSFFMIFSVSHHIQGHTNFLSHFPRFSDLLPQSWSYWVCFSFYSFFSVARHISCPTM